MSSSSFKSKLLIHKHGKVLSCVSNKHLKRISFLKSFRPKDSWLISFEMQTTRIKILTSKAYNTSRGYQNTEIMWSKESGRQRGSWERIQSFSDLHFLPLQLLKRKTPSSFSLDLVSGWRAWETRVTRDRFPRKELSVVGYVIPLHLPLLSSPGTSCKLLFNCNHYPSLKLLFSWLTLPHSYFPHLSLLICISKNSYEGKEVTKELSREKKSLAVTRYSLLFIPFVSDGDRGN